MPTAALWAVAPPPGSDAVDICDRLGPAGSVPTDAELCHSRHSCILRHKSVPRDCVHDNVIVNDSFTYNAVLSCCGVLHSRVNCVPEHISS